MSPPPTPAHPRTHTILRGSNPTPPTPSSTILSFFSPPLLFLLTAAARRRARALAAAHPHPSCRSPTPASAARLCRSPAPAEPAAAAALAPSGAAPGRSALQIRPLEIHAPVRRAEASTDAPNPRDLGPVASTWRGHNIAASLRVAGDGFPTHAHATLSLLSPRWLPPPQPHVHASFPRLLPPLLAPSTACCSVPGKPPTDGEGASPAVRQAELPASGEAPC
ncbi:hypothetical protein PVAP13_4NG214800 [Panicum virgatum]|uniref:Uncharacterized protein n=1 Tax=Panicum virgatum TaxID=38727 RepID=A0A8T0TBY0_PANVG|nr:hypothetical protein PVAP13_4NG214800 [Panicum virgatum]